MAPHLASTKPLELPVVSFSVLPPEQHQAPHLAHQPQLIQFGYNDGQEWSGYQECKESLLEGGGGRYLRWIQPLESELAKQVEYDMDEQDKVWLDTLNSERKKEALLPIPYEIFEVIMDKLEKEWFDLTKSIPKKSNAIPSENEKCAICDDGECENSNAIVFCDGCNLAVHQDCYGVPYIPEGQWLCRKCTVSPDKPVDCVFCPMPFGAFKQTTTGHWGHLLCAIWIPETGVSNTVYMEPIDGVELVPKSRWKLNCYLCKKKFGASIQCSNRSCYTAYHVTCAREFGLEVRMKQPGSNTNSTGSELKSWCDKHGKVQWDLFSQSRAAAPSSSRIPQQQQHQHHSHPLQQQYQQHLTLTGPTSSPSLSLKSTNVASFPFPNIPASSLGYSATPGPLSYAAPTNNSFSNSFSPRPSTPSNPVVPLASSKSLRSKKTHLSPIKQTPLIPQFIFDRIVAYISRVKGLTGKKDVVNSVCRYWSLKREGRMGAPLLKRIHLEPWTASATSRIQSDTDRAAKLELIKLLRSDLEKVRMLTEQIRKREKKKLEKLRWVKETILDGFVWPKETKLRDALKEIISWDKQQFFLNPVDRELVPDYYEIIKSPMDWNAMYSKIDRHEYSNARQFADDANLVMQNAQIYNKPSSPVHKLALKILEKLEPLLVTLVKELDDPLGDLSVREELAPRLLLEEFEFDPDREKEIMQTVSDAGGEAQEVIERRAEDRVIMLEELERVWYNPDDPRGDKKEKALKAARENVRVAEEATRDNHRLEKERIEKVRKEKEDAGEFVQEAKRNVVTEQAAEEKAKKQGDIEMATSPTTVATTSSDAKDSKKSKKRKAKDSQTKPKADKKKKKKEHPPQTDPTPPHALDPAPDTIRNISINEDLPEDEVPVPVISNRDTFTMFETGWVLPEGSSRRKTTTPSSSTIPLPSTATGLAPPKGSTASSSRQTPRTTAAALPEIPASSTTTSTSKPVGLGVSTESTARKGQEVGKEAKVAEVKQNLQKDTKLVTGTSNMVTNVATQQAVKEWLSKFTSLGGKVMVQENTDLSDGVLVWHRAAGQNAFYPAEMADPKGPDMPKNLLASRPKAKDGTFSSNRFPLLYFDEKRSGAWVTRSELRLLGEDKDFDQLLMQPAAVKAYIKAKNSRQCIEYAKTLAEAYEFAVSNVEIDGEAEQPAEGGAPADGKRKKPKKNKTKRKSQAGGEQAGGN